MPLLPVSLSDGQVSGVDPLSPACSSLSNFEVDEAGANRPRAALVQPALTDVTDSVVNGLFVWRDPDGVSNLIIADVNGVWQRVRSVAPTVAANISDATAASKLTGGGRPVFAPGIDHVYATAGGQVRRWTPIGGVGELLTASPACTHIVALGDRLVANTEDGFAWSDIGEGAWDVWPAANVAAASARPDPVVGIFGSSTDLFVFGEETLQVYQVGSDPEFPWDLAAASTAIGLAAPYACAEVDDGVLVLLDNRNRIVRTDGRSQEDIGVAIQKDLRALSTVSDAFAYRETIDQFDRVVFRFPTAQRTFVYDLKGKKWSERRFHVAGLVLDYPVHAYAHWPATGERYVGVDIADYTTPAGQVASLDISTTSENVISTGDAVVVAERVTGAHDFGTEKRKRSNRIVATMKRGTSSTSTVADQGALEIRVQDDGGAWSDWEQIPMGAADDAATDPQVHPGGVFRHRKYHVRYSNTEAMSLLKLFDDVEELAS